jgi:hypothetical protein
MVDAPTESSEEEPSKPIFVNIPAAGRGVPTAPRPRG